MATAPDVNTSPLAPPDHRAARTHPGTMSPNRRRTRATRRRGARPPSAVRRRSFLAARPWPG